MKRIIAAAALLALVSCQEQKIGYVDQVKIMDEYQKKIDVEQEYQMENAEFSKRRDSISMAFQKEAQELQENSKRLSQARAQEKMGEFQQKAQAVGQQLQQVEQQLRMKGQARMDSVVTKVRDEIRAYGKANGYTFILGGGDGGSVIYGDEGKDLTEEILSKLNSEYQQ